MDTWNPPVIETLSRHFRVIVFDNRGTGYSGASGEPFSVPLFAQDTAGLMDALGISRAHVLGFSMGACIAQELALAFPEKVDRLILVAGDCGGAEAVRTDPDVFSRLIDKSGTIEDVVNRMFPLLFPPAWLATHDPFRYCPRCGGDHGYGERRPAARGIFVLARLVLPARKNPVADARDCRGRRRGGPARELAAACRKNPGRRDCHLPGRRPRADVPVPGPVQRDGCLGFYKSDRVAAGKKNVPAPAVTILACGHQGFFCFPGFFLHMIRDWMMEKMVMITDVLTLHCGRGVKGFFGFFWEFPGVPPVGPVLGVRYDLPWDDRASPGYMVRVVMGTADRDKREVLLFGDYRGNAGEVRPDRDVMCRGVRRARSRE